jgi:hypothetical protein
MSLRKKLLLWLGVPVAALLLVAVLLPWNKWVESALRSQLAASGLEKLDFHIEKIGTGGITFKDVSLGADSNFKLDSITVGYGILDLLNGNIQGLKTGVLTFSHNGKEIAIDGAEANLLKAEDGNGLSGTWNIRGIRLSGMPVPVPPLEGKGTIQWNQILKVAGGFASADNTHKADFALDYPLADAAKAKFNLSGAQFPWNSGKISVQPFSALLFDSKPVALKLNLDNVSLNALMQQATGNRATATGMLSGILPVTVARDGSFTVQKGNLKTAEVGTIILPPDVIPGDHPQVEVVREVLKNFHYTDFSLTVDSKDPKKLSMLLSLKGNNPDVYNGRMVNLNVNLAGDLLDLLQQGLVTITDPKQLLKQGNNEKP